MSVPAPDARRGVAAKVAGYYPFRSALSKVLCLHPEYLATSLLLRATRDVVPSPTGSAQESSFDSNPAAAFDLSLLRQEVPS